jgi:hypothetical protein
VPSWPTPLALLPQLLHQLHPKPHLPGHTIAADLLLLLLVMVAVVSMLLGSLQLRLSQVVAWGMASSVQGFSKLLPSCLLLQSGPTAAAAAAAVWELVVLLLLPPLQPTGQ